MLKTKYHLSDVQKNNKSFKSFGTFICAGGSSIGYRLAGFNHLGGVEIDEKCAKLYKKNLNPKYLFIEDIRDFNKRVDLPEELYNLDLLDGSPPCSTFSVCGNRDKAWGKKKKFTEGQKSQTLDDLVFVYCDTILKLKPKVAILENVSGIIKGNAKIYSKKIIEKLQAGGYSVQIFSLNSSLMLVPQNRQRVFFIAHRVDLKFPKLKLDFKNPLIRFGLVRDKNLGKPLYNYEQKLLNYVEKGDKTYADIAKRKLGKDSYFNCRIVDDDKVCPTIISGGSYTRFADKLRFTDNDFINCGAFPQDYDFMGHSVQYFIGMSVPPLMTAHIAKEIIEQWLKVENQSQQN